MESQVSLAELSRRVEQLVEIVHELANQVATLAAEFHVVMGRGAAQWHQASTKS